MGADFDLTKYVSTHNVGGAVMGDNPKTSALNKYLQSWDVHNVFVPGGNAFRRTSRRTRPILSVRSP